MTEIPKPGPRKGYEKIAVAAQDAGKQLDVLKEAMPQNKEQGPRKPFVRKEHLTQRPFRGPLVDLRKSMPNVRIKNK